MRSARFQRWTIGSRLTLVVAALAVALAFTGGCAGGGSRDHSMGATADTREGAERRASLEAARARFEPMPFATPSAVRTASGLPGPEYWQQEVDYVIDATLDAEAQQVTARQVVTYTNNSPHALPFLWFHLEQNLFKEGSDGSKVINEGTRFGPKRSSDYGFRFTRVRAGGAEAILTEHDTVGRIDLPAPVPARGGTVTIELEYSFKIPTYGADRFAIQDVADGKIFQLAQWFPAAATYDDVRGWNTLPYLGQGEFYTNFGDYEVALTVPRSHIVAATGELTNASDVLTPVQVERVAAARATTKTVVIRGIDEINAASRPAGEGPLTWRFSAKNCRTFAWSSSPAFIWDAAGINWGDGTGVLAQSVYPREATPLWSSEATDMLRFSIEHYSEKWFRYPYPSAVNVNGSVGGMEYPMVIYCAERHDQRGLFGVTTHEIGHNWFPMVVNTDERRHAWQDEGFNTFINYYAGPARNSSWTPGRGEARGFASRMLDENMQIMDTPADQVLGWMLGVTQYEKPAVGLVLLREKILGPARFDPAFKQYISAWAFKSPMPSDFFRCMENAAGQDLSWFWRGWFYSTHVMDQAIAEVKEDDRVTTRWRVTIANRGGLVMPIEYEITFDDGSTLRRAAPAEVWYFGDRWTDDIGVEGKRITRVVLDPDQAYPDVDPSNNEWGE